MNSFIKFLCFDVSMKLLLISCHLYFLVDMKLCPNMRVYSLNMGVYCILLLSLYN